MKKVYSFSGDFIKKYYILNKNVKRRSKVVSWFDCPRIGFPQFSWERIRKTAK